MGVSKVSVSLDGDVVSEVRERAGPRGLSAYVNQALRRQLQHDRIAELLAEMEREAGPVPAHLLEEARALWHGTERSSRPQRSA